MLQSTFVPAPIDTVRMYVRTYVHTDNPFMHVMFMILYVRMFVGTYFHRRIVVFFCAVSIPVLQYVVTVHVQYYTCGSSDVEHFT